MSAYSKKLIKDAEENFKKFQVQKEANEVKIYNSVEGINVEQLKRALELKSQMDVLASQIKVIDNEYQNLRAQIIQNLPGEEKSKVEALVGDILIKKYFREGRKDFDEEAVRKLSIEKGIYRNVFQQKEVMIVEELFKSLSIDELSYEDLIAVQVKGSKVTPVLELSQKVSQTDHNLESQVEKPSDELSKKRKKKT